MDGFRFPLSLTFLFFVAALAAGCGSPVKTAKSAAPGFNVGGGGASDPANPTEDDAPSEAAGIFFKITSDATVNIHKSLTPYVDGTNTRVDTGTGNWSEECRIATTAADGTRDILCVAEVEELDMYFSDLNLQYHVPPSMCSYVSFIPYHFFAYEVAVGPNFVSHEEDSAGNIISQTNAPGGVANCDYDFRGSDGPNCCLGTYTRVITKPAPTSTDPTATATTVERNVRWGGNAASCLSGPALSSEWTNRDRQGYPVASLEYVAGAGLNKTFKILKAFEKTIGTKRITSNVYAANFYNASDHVGSGGLVPTTVPVTDPNRPIGMKIPVGSFSDDRYFPDDTYMLTCFDRAEEIKSRVRLMIREWSTEADYQDGGNPDVSGTTDPDFPDNDINDRLDWLDFGNNYSASST